MHRHQNLETDGGEDLWVSFSWHGRVVYLCVVYIKSNAPDIDYIRWFCKVESVIISLKAPVLIVGDLNLNSASSTVNDYYCYFMTFCRLSERNDVRNEFGGILDVVLVQESDDVCRVFVAPTDKIVKIDPYHPPLDIQFEIDPASRPQCLEPTNIINARDWNFKKCDFERLYILLKETSWSPVLEANDVHTATKNFYDIIYSYFDECIPKKRRTHGRSRRYPVWFSSDIINDVKLKNKLHKSWTRTKSDEMFRQFSNLRADLKCRTANAYGTYLEGIEENIKLNPRQFWRHISSLRTKGGFEPTVSYKGESFTGVSAAEAFASYFAGVFLPDIPTLNTEFAYDLDHSCNSNYVNIFQITPSDVIYGINKLKPSSAVGPDCVPPAVLKQVKRQVCIPFCHIFNTALKTGKYPVQWKLSRVSPIPKSSNKSSVEEYRPIAVLSSPAKVLESIIHKYIYAQVDKYLCNAQHGFRRKRSVDTNLLAITDFISSKLDRGSQVDVLYFDFRKAFDRVNNDILLVKLGVIGFAPGLLRLIADYLRDRQQFVRLGLYESRSYHTRSGVSQGSILGPLLFLLMVNDLPCVLEFAQCLLYADDLKLFAEVNSHANCIALQRDIDAVVRWSHLNGMEFNISKCCAVTFGRIRRPIIFDYKINDDTITRSTMMKDLGVVFDQRLTFHDHINYLAKESFRRLGFVLRNSKDFHDTNVISLIYGALVRSKLESSMCVWNPYEKKYILQLEKVQKAFLRFLYKRIHGYYPFMYPTNFLLGCLGYNSLKVRREKQQLSITCKILRGDVDAPDLHDKLCKLYVPDNYYRCRYHKLFANPRCRTVAHSNSPIPRTLTALNALLKANPECDVFENGWMDLLSAFLAYCENKA